MILEFGIDEVLYRRFNLSSGSGPLPLAAWSQYSNISTNRSSLCKVPEDVLYNAKSASHFLNWGIVKVGVEGIHGHKIKHPNNGSRTFELRVEHAPETCMYPHTEIRLFEGENQIDNVSSKALRLLVKDTLAEICSLVKKPMYT